MHEGFYSLFVKSSSGEGTETLAASSGTHMFASDWSRDGRHVLATTYDPKANLSSDVAVLDVGTGEMTPLLTSEFDEQSAKLSPDGNWLAYVSNDSGRNELYVVPFPGPGGKWQISAEGCSGDLFWASHGLTLYYGTEGGTKKRVELTARDAALEIGSPEILFEGPEIANWLSEPGRDTFLAFRSEARVLEAPLTLVTNWSAPFEDR
jgi:Tol biopolymer transport system component